MIAYDGQPNVSTNEGPQYNTRGTQHSGSEQQPSAFKYFFPITVGLIRNYLNMIMGDLEVTSHDLHAWPELYLEGVGWVILDISAKKNLDPPAKPVDKDLQRKIGEMARQEPPDGVSRLVLSK